MGLLEVLLKRGAEVGDGGGREHHHELGEVDLATAILVDLGHGGLDLTGQGHARDSGART